jgi:predicted HNH restriction endonuclease
MNEVEIIYKAIKVMSRELKTDAETWTRKIGSSKNYVATPDLKYWTFGKSVGKAGEYHDYGGAAKQYLYRIGFKNVLQLKDKTARATVTEAFRSWAGKLKGSSILEKFDKDQLSAKRFELLVHEDVLKELGISTAKRKSATTQDAFDEGFKKQIAREVSVRDRKVIQLAKETHGTICVVCQFDFGKTYGSHGAGFIEMHHLHPIALGDRTTTVDDLRPVCPNCHRMLHKGHALLSIEELKRIMKEAGKGHKK